MSTTFRNDLSSILADGLKATFLEAFNVRPNFQWDKIATLVPSSPGRQSESFAFLSELAFPKEWLDERDIKRMSEYAYSIPIKKYESTIKVAREDIDADRLGAVALKVRDMARKANVFIENQVFRTLSNGFTANGFDGTTFFSTAHPRKGGLSNQSNRGTAALSAASLDTARDTMLSWTDDQGEPLGVVGDTLVVSPSLASAARKLVGSPVVVVNVGDGTAGSGSTAATNYININQGEFDLIISPHLTSANSWFMVDSSQVLKPVLYVEADPIEFSSLDSPDNNESAFLRDAYLYGTRQRFGVGYGPWWTAYGNIV